MCLVAFQKIFRKIFSGVWKRRRKRQTQEKNHQRSRSRRHDLDLREIAISRSGRRTGAREIGVDWSSEFACDHRTDQNVSSPLARARALSLSYKISGNTLKGKWKCKMISVVKGIFFRSTDFNFRKIEFSGPTKQPHFRKSISGSDFHPKQTHPKASSGL